MKRISSRSCRSHDRLLSGKVSCWEASCIQLKRSPTQMNFSQIGKRCMNTGQAVTARTVSLCRDCWWTVRFKHHFVFLQPRTKHLSQNYDLWWWPSNFEQLFHVKASKPQMVGVRGEDWLLRFTSDRKKNSKQIEFFKKINWKETGLNYTIWFILFSI